VGPGKRGARGLRPLDGGPRRQRDGGKTCDARGTGVGAERGCDSCSRNVDPRWQREEEESAGSCWRSRLLEARWAAVTRGEGGAGHAGGGPGAWAVQRSAERVLAR
jgi:hypothetical protein